MASLVVLPDQGLQVTPLFFARYVQVVTIVRWHGSRLDDARCPAQRQKRLFSSAVNCKRSGTALRITLWRFRCNPSQPPIDLERTSKSSRESRLALLARRCHSVSLMHSLRDRLPQFGFLDREEAAVRCLARIRRGREDCRRFAALDDDNPLLCLEGRATPIASRGSVCKDRESKLCAAINGKVAAAPKTLTRSVAMTISVSMLIPLAGR